jgi:hypothetical protein
MGLVFVSHLVTSDEGTLQYIGDDVWLIRVSFNSTLESLPLLSAIDWATVSPLTGSWEPSHFLCS